VNAILRAVLATPCFVTMSVAVAIAAQGGTGEKSKEPSTTKSAPRATPSPNVGQQTSPTQQAISDNKQKSLPARSGVGSALTDCKTDRWSACKAD
jgi:hypothetical protein